MATGPTIFSFTEDWYEGSKVIASAHTLGTVRYEPGNGTNIYTHTQQMPGVVVKSEDSRKGISTVDPVLNSPLPIVHGGKEDRLCD